MVSRVRSAPRPGSSRGADPGGRRVGPWNVTGSFHAHVGRQLRSQADELQEPEQLDVCDDQAQVRGRGTDAPVQADQRRQSGRFEPAGRQIDDHLVGRGAPRAVEPGLEALDSGVVDDATYGKDEIAVNPPYLVEC